MFKTMYEYMQQDTLTRQMHLDLSAECMEIGGNSLQFRGLLAHHLSTFIPQKREGLLCHACHNAACSNPKHLYWGTYSENLKDSFKAGRKTPYQYIVEKHGEEYAKNTRAKGGKANLGVKHKS